MLEVPIQVQSLAAVGDERLRAVIAHAPIIVCAWDVSGVCTLLEGRGLQALGARPETVVGENLFQVLGDRPAALDCMARVAAGETVAELIEIGPACLDAFLSPVYDESGTLTGGLGVATDVTHRAVAEERQRRQSARFQALAEVSRALAEAGTEYAPVLETITRRAAELVGDSCTIRLLSDDSRWLDTVAVAHRDPEAEELLRQVMTGNRQPAHAEPYGSVAATGRTLFAPRIEPNAVRDRAPAEYAPYIERYPVHSAVLAPLLTRGTGIGEIALARHAADDPYDEDDRTFVEELADRAATAIETARLFQASASELSERRAAEAALREAQQVLQGYADELARANQELVSATQVKDNVIAVTSHELRTPLTSILGFASTLRQRWDDISEEDRRHLVVRMEAQAQRLHTLVRDLLTLSTVDAGALNLELRSVLLGAVVREICAHDPQLSDVVVDIPQDLTVQVDRARLEQILTNFLSNAVKYGAPPIGVGAQQVGEHVELRVWDHGPGVPEKFRNQLFERFTQADMGPTRETPGTGLGLAIVCSLARAMGGDVWYDDSGPGACFVLRMVHASG